MGKNCGSITSLWPQAATDADHGEREASAEDTSSVRAIGTCWATPLREGDLLIATVLVHSRVARVSHRVHVWLRRAQTIGAHKTGGNMGEQGTRGLMTVGELASRVGVTVRTIQYYDQRGLLHPTCKGEQNLRLYSPADEERLNRIITLKYLGFSLSQIQEGEGSDSLAELTDALAHREAELERESAKILRDMNVVQGLRAHLANRDQANWSELAATVGVAQDREDMLWSAITGEALEECPIPELSREEVICWHQLMGDTIEAMHDGVLVTDDRAKALAIRFSSLGGMPHALAGLKRLACQRSSGPKQYGRDFYAGIQRRTLSFLQDALDCSHANANTQA